MGEDLLMSHKFRILRSHTGFAAGVRIWSSNVLFPHGDFKMACHICGQFSLSKFLPPQGVVNAVDLGESPVM